MKIPFTDPVYRGLEELKSNKTTVFRAMVKNTPLQVFSGYYDSLRGAGYVLREIVGESPSEYLPNKHKAVCWFSDDGIAIYKIMVGDNSALARCDVSGKSGDCYTYQIVCRFIGSIFDIPGVRNPVIVPNIELGSEARVNGAIGRIGGMEGDPTKPWSVRYYVRALGTHRAYNIEVQGNEGEWRLAHDYYHRRDKPECLTWLYQI